MFCKGLVAVRIDFGVLMVHLAVGHIRKTHIIICSAGVWLCIAYFKDANML